MKLVARVHFSLSHKFVFRDSISLHWIYFKKKERKNENIVQGLIFNGHRNMDSAKKPKLFNVTSLKNSLVNSLMTFILPTFHWTNKYNNLNKKESFGKQRRKSVDSFISSFMAPEIWCFFYFFQQFCDRNKFCLFFGPTATDNLTEFFDIFDTATATVASTVAAINRYYLFLLRRW